jgi:hypothetical protein
VIKYLVQQQSIIPTNIDQAGDTFMALLGELEGPVCAYLQHDHLLLLFQKGT